MHPTLRYCLLITLLCCSEFVFADDTVTETKTYEQGDALTQTVTITTTTNDAGKTIKVVTQSTLIRKSDDSVHSEVTSTDTDGDLKADTEVSKIYSTASTSNPTSITTRSRNPGDTGWRTETITTDKDSDGDPDSYEEYTSNKGNGEYDTFSTQTVADGKTTLDLPVDGKYTRKTVKAPIPGTAPVIETGKFDDVKKSPSDINVLFSNNTSPFLMESSPFDIDFNPSGSLINFNPDLYLASFMGNENSNLFDDPALGAYWQLPNFIADGNGNFLNSNIAPLELYAGNNLLMSGVIDQFVFIDSSTSPGADASLQGYFDISSLNTAGPLNGLFTDPALPLVDSALLTQLNNQFDPLGSSYQDLVLNIDLFDVTLSATGELQGTEASRGIAYFRAVNEPSTIWMFVGILPLIFFMFTSRKIN